MVGLEPWIFPSWGVVPAGRVPIGGLANKGFIGQRNIWLYEDRCFSTSEINRQKY